MQYKGLFQPLLLYSSNVASRSLELTNNLKIANQRGVALILLASIHPMRNESKTGAMLHQSAII